MKKENKNQLKKIRKSVEFHEKKDPKAFGIFRGR